MTDKKSEIDHYLEDVDNEEEWGETIKATPKRRLDAVVSVRFSPDELETIRNAAPDGNVSNFIRTATMNATDSMENGWMLSVTLNGSTQRDNGYIASSPDSNSTKATMVLSDWDLPTVHLEVAS